MLQYNNPTAGIAISLLKTMHYGSLSRRGTIKGMVTAGAAGPLLIRGAALRAMEISGAVSHLSVTGPRLKILAVADLHFFNRTRGHDLMTLRDMKKMIERFQPHLLLACGDVWHDNPRGKGERFCGFTCEKLGGLGVPWAFVRAV